MLYGIYNTQIIKNVYFLILQYGKNYKIHAFAWLWIKYVNNRLEPRLDTMLTQCLTNFLFEAKKYKIQYLMSKKFSCWATDFSIPMIPALTLCTEEPWRSMDSLLWK